MLKRKPSTQKQSASPTTSNPVSHSTSMGKWFLWLLFPAYGLYVLWRKNKIKWYIKVPITLFIALILVLSVDTALNPYRVEDDLSKETMKTYLAEHPEKKMGSLRRFEREGVFHWKNETLIVYRAVTHNGLYHVVVQNTKGNRYLIDSIFQVYPAQTWMEPSKLKIPAVPMAMVYFQKHIYELGEIQEGYEENDILKIRTNKGVFRYTFEKQKVVSIEKENGEIVLQQRKEYAVPKEVTEYFQKHENEYGKWIEVFGYDLDTVKEMYHIRTEKGRYRVDHYDNGNLTLLEAKENK